jgi:heme a synthase
MSDVSLNKMSTQPAQIYVRIWLWCVAALVFAMVIVGGATRLTESGLSITEWNPVMGIIPPLSLGDWQIEFEKYKHIPQYAQLFPDMDLARFQFIYYWEWSHRLLGRFIGFALIVPLIIFWWRGFLTRALKWKLLGLFALGGLQGAVGWWMVASGLVGRVEVAPERLATHLFLASLTFAFLVALASSLAPRRFEAVRLPQRRIATLILCAIMLQIVFGALVAGSRAGLVYNTWPLMDGSFIPPLTHLTQLDPVWLNFFENVTTIQFTHRMMAYLVAFFVFIHAWQMRSALPSSQAQQRALVLAGLVVLQIVIGIGTLVHSVPLWAGLAHQSMAMIVLAFAVYHRIHMHVTAL